MAGKRKPRSKANQRPNSADRLNNNRFHALSEEEDAGSEVMANKEDNNTGAVLITNQLTSSNYFTWKCAMLRALTVKEKLKFIESDPPSKDDPSYNSWKKNDCLVITWILNSIHKDYVESFVFTSSARSLWKELEQRYGENNSPMLFKLKRQLSRTTQGNMSVCAYFTSLKRIWDELYLLRPTPTCNCEESSKMSDFVEEDRVMEFLCGLNDQYEHVVNQILLMEPLPTVNKAFSMVVKVERQKEVGVDSHLEFANYATKNISSGSHNSGHNQKINSEGEEDDPKSKLYCEICKKWRHSTAQCFRVVGYPHWWTGKKKKLITGKFQGKKDKMSQFSSRVNAVQSKVKGSPFSDSDSEEEVEEDTSTQQMIQELYRMMKGKEKKHSTKPNFSAFAGFSGLSGAGD